MQTFANRDSLIVTTEDGTATIYSKKDVSGVTKGKADVAVKPTPSNGKWSEYQGDMNWEDAKKKCASIGMRLPTRAEADTAYKAKMTDSWKADWQKSGYTGILDLRAPRYKFCKQTQNSLGDRIL